MEFSIKFCEGLFEVDIFRKFNISQVDGFLNTLISHGQWKPGSAVLIDETQFDSDNFTTNDMYNTLKYFEKHRIALGKARMAIIVDRDLEYGMNRMWEVMAEGKADIQFKLFRLREEAIPWLI